MFTKKILPPLLAAAAAVLSGCATVPSGTSQRPNFVVILADDMGFSDAGCYGGEIATPNLDTLAAGGLRFTQFYNTARCWPTRASLLTGYYPQQVNRDNFPGDRKGGNQGRRPAWAKLLPDRLKPLGYRSYHSGKWHVDGKVLAGGFDHSYSLDDHNRYFSPNDHKLDDQPLPAIRPGDGYYATTAIARHAVDMLQDHGREHAAQPFFLYLAFNAPHYPLHALPGDFDAYRNTYAGGWDLVREQRQARIRGLGLLDCALSSPQPEVFAAWSFPEARLRDQIDPGEMGRYAPWPSLDGAQKQFQPVKMALHAAMIHRMDIEIGRVLGQLREMNALDNTVIFFLTDNGATAEQIIRGDLHDKSARPGSAATFLALGPGWSTAANTPFRHHKSWVHEGGIATPLIVSWPRGITDRGGLRATPGHVVDIPPTILELASSGNGGTPSAAGDGSAAPPMEGRSLLPAFARDGTVSRDFLWWCHDGNRAIRVGDWKLVADHKNDWELYDLASDRSEMHDLAAAHPGRVREMESAWQQRADLFRRQREDSQAPRPGN